MVKAEISSLLICLLASAEAFVGLHTRNINLLRPNGGLGRATGYSRAIRTPHTPPSMILDSIAAVLTPEHLETFSTHISTHLPHIDTLLLLADETSTGQPGASIGYSNYSYYTSLGLYILSFPGLWSVIKRAAKTKYKERVYLAPGPLSTVNPKPIKQSAAEVVAYFQANNYAIQSAGEEITFEGVVMASKGQAFFLVFCTALSLATLSLVLQVVFPGPGNLWFLLTLVSPYAGIYYWQNAQRRDKARVRIESNEDETVTEINITAGEEELDRMAKVMGYEQKGMVRVRGLLEE